MACFIYFLDNSKRTDIWALHLINFDDEEQFEVCYQLLKKLPHAIYYYLSHDIFPIVMRHQGMKISASGQELGSGMLFPRRFLAHTIDVIS